MDDQLREAMAALKGGDKKRASRLAMQVIKADSDPKCVETAWLILSFTVTDPARRRHCYEAVLLLNPDNTTAQKGLAKLEASTVATSLTIEPATVSSAEQVATHPQASGSETLNARLERLQAMVLGLIRPLEGEKATPAGSDKIPVSGLQMLGLVACFLLALGVFMPIVSLPIVGQLDYFQSGRGDGTIILILAIISTLLILLRRYNWLWLTTLPAVTMLAFTLISLMRLISEMNQTVSEELQDDLFGGLASLLVESVQIEWGWVVLIVGGLLLISIAIFGRHDAWHRFAIGGGALSVAVLLILLLGDGSALGSDALATGNGRSGRSERVKVGEPARYEAGQLRVLQVHDPSAFYVTSSSALDLEAPEPVRGTRFVAVELEFVCSEETQVVCEHVPEANLELSLADGRQAEDEWDIYDAPELDDEDISGGEAATGWVAFRVPENAELEAIIVNPNAGEASFSIALPESRDGYQVNHAWYNLDEGRARIMPEIRRSLQVKGIDAPMVGMIDSDTDFVVVSVCEETGFYFDEEEALQEHGKTISDIVMAAADYLGDAEFLFMTLQDCELAVGSEVQVTITNENARRYRNDQFSFQQLLQRVYVSIE